jgi:hypothetical protein
MRKLSKTRSPDLKRNTLDSYLADTRQRRIPGATITAGTGPPDIDLEAFFASPASDATLTGAVTDKAAWANRPAEGTVSLSDGTLVTFATNSHFDIVGSV